MVQEKPLTLYGLTLEDYEQVLYIDESSQSGLRWRITVSATATKDSVAGCYSDTVKNPCWRIKVKKKPMVLARVLWFMYYKDFVPEVVDHRNGNTKDHSIGNLRAFTQKLNTENRVVLNETGTPGVYLREDKYGNPIFRCQGVNKDGKRWSKVFAVNKYGMDEAFRLATQFRLSKEDENNTQTRRVSLSDA